MKKHYRIDFHFMNSDYIQFMVVHGNNKKDAKNVVNQMNLDIVILSIKKLSY